MNENDTVSIIIPVYNKWELTRNCLESLHAHTPEGKYEVIAVDNASEDGTATNLETLGRHLFAERFTRIRNEENRNFAGACNQGAKIASRGLLLFLNNDTVLTPGWLPPLTAALAGNTKLAAVGPLLLYPDNTVQHLGAAIFPDRSIQHFHSRIPASHGLARKRRMLDFITAAALLIRKDLFLAAGAFHEEYVNGLEDVDLCYKLRTAGYALTVVPESIVYHLESQTRGNDSPPVNNLVLRRRNPELRTPRFHHIADADGYTPYFDPFFATFLAPHPERLKRYASPAVSGNAAILSSILDREIYWEEGYAALARMYEQSGNAAEALRVVEKGIRFHPSLRLMRQALSLAEKSEETALARGYAEYLGQAGELSRNKQYFATRYAVILETALARKDEFLRRMITRWHEEFGDMLEEKASHNKIR